MYSAQEFFDNFYNNFLQKRKEHPEIFMTSGKYTQFMMQFLKELAEKQGFNVKEERLTIDQVWKSNIKGTIAVEHEISSSGILKKELPNLMDISSNLKVLITYVYDYQFPWEPETISRKIRSLLNEKYTRCAGEFLLLIGTKTRRDEKDRRKFMERETDWFARWFYIGAFKESVLIPSASRRARKAHITIKKRTATLS